MRKILYISVSSAIILIVGLFFLVKFKCCDSDESAYQVYDGLVVEAVAGNMLAIDKLYGQAVSEGRRDAAVRWARHGALEGSDKYLKIYVLNYESMGELERKNELSILLRNSEKVGYSALLSAL